ncbi:MULTISPECIES: RNA polymerase subunit sigma-70 [unclassified Bradyrhizobium]|uniref:RNA polymerase subunit sigma-70 n=1 Tax=unclassified Bradyrhizobium TaxID=2631580 RepID=UPI0024789B23|nr:MULTISPECIES: RNA polymerase subunit sigma-70 [unclassified Bradyrhizobium]WGS00961.1 RNA polymerase subunit sigma-70 [Bradyrhizobium sp. ISRA436]WGS07848.1 RNA polymerase subunit sigma-70 [Bradyrhizobium sp. ISRA437]WGS14736.1 RNA polymerase subunit sigma-70 [Bradyrhizobium sp. ISRA443]WGS22348.1 RNA polymerase subunit sigma-70 [Bradyrhizobium sp. ISRA463]WGS29321.1 RNA polymerase subunit sigma-70 [Bradyrhizobium sp. ISRA464]
MDLRKIIEAAREINDRTGAVTSDQLNELCPKELSLEDVQALLKALRDEGIQLADKET